MKYKHAGIIFAALALSAVAVMADDEELFTNLSTGKDWNAASSQDRLAYCTNRQESLVLMNPEITPQALMEAITEYYSSSDPKVLATTLPQLIASIVAPAGQ